MLNLIFTGIDFLQKFWPSVGGFNFRYCTQVLGGCLELTEGISFSQMIHFYFREEAVDWEKKFEPGLVNSVVYIVSMSMQVSTFVVNYRVSCHIFCCMLYLEFGRILIFIQ